MTHALLALLLAAGTPGTTGKPAKAPTPKPSSAPIAAAPAICAIKGACSHLKSSAAV